MALSFNPLSAPADITTFVDPQALQNLPEARYRLGAVRLDYALRHNHFPNAPWRSVGATHTAFFLESFVDEIARATNTDPLEMRRKLLAGDARALNVINVAADKAGWGKPLPKGHALGIAYFESFGSLCAQVAEVSVAADGMPHVHRVVCAMDCGEIVTPDGATSQIEGGIIQSLSAAMFEAVHLEKGASVERNFDGYRLMRINEAPARIEVHLIASGEKIGGIGEPPVPPLAPAVANAYARASGGKVLRRLPFAQSARSAKSTKSA
jgi:isoquinoline 1-oxidoreductase beta subunit